MFGGALDTAGQIGMDKNVYAIFAVTQDIIRTTTDDDAGALIRHFADDVGLRQENLVVKGQILHGGAVVP